MLELVNFHVFAWELMWDLINPRSFCLHQGIWLAEKRQRKTVNEIMSVKMCS